MQDPSTAIIPLNFYLNPNQISYDKSNQWYKSDKSNKNNKTIKVDKSNKSYKSDKNDKIDKTGFITFITIKLKKNKILIFNI